jgi:hypothetical protein
VRRWLLVLLAAPAAAAACPPQAADGALLSAPGVQAAWRVADAAGIAVSEHFVLLVRLCPATAELQAVDATMPAHRHGMNYRPTLQALGGGRWRVEGLLLHMPGTWELRLDTRLDGRTQALRTTIELP